MHTCIYISYIHTRHSPLSQCLPPFSLARGHLGAYETRCHWGNTSSRRRWSSWHQFQIAVRQQQFILHKDTREASADYTRASVHHAEMDIILPLEHVNSAPLIENEIYLIRMLGPSLGRGPCPGWRPCLCSRCPRASQIAFSLNQFPITTFEWSPRLQLHIIVTIAVNMVVSGDTNHLHTIEIDYKSHQK